MEILKILKIRLLMLLTGLTEKDISIVTKTLNSFRFEHLGDERQKLVDKVANKWQKFDNNTIGYRRFWQYKEYKRIKSNLSSPE